MPSTLRATAAAVVLAGLLGLCTVPAQAQPAQPKGAQAQSRVETKVLEQVWRWLTGLWASPGAREQAQEGLTLVTGRSSDLGSLNRGGVYDPNGHP